MYFQIFNNPNKSNRGDKNPYQGLNKIKNINIGEVIDVNDPNDLGRIKVRIKGSRNKGGDDGILDNDLPWAFPMIPKHLGIKPRVAEAVFIFFIDNSTMHADRLYVGPINSQPQYLERDPYYFTALSPFTFGSEEPNVSVRTIPEILGVFPNEDDVSIQGRYNTDITQKKNEVLLRAGKFTVTTKTTENPYGFKFNTDTQAYIQIKNDAVIQPSTNQQEGKRGTVTNIVANKINLLTHEFGSPRFILTDQETLISDTELAKILQEAHQVPFGDVLLQYLQLLKNAFLNHVHNGNGNTPTDLNASGNQLSVKAFSDNAKALEAAMLSKNIRIN